MNSLRVLTMTLALLSMGMNLTLAVQGVRFRQVIFMPLVFVVYTLTAAGTNGVSIYFRLHDSFYSQPVNAGDFTVFIPTLGFFLGAVLGLRALARRIGHHQIAQVIDLDQRSVTERTRSTDHSMSG